VIGALRRRYSDTVRTKRSILNVISTTKPKTLLVITPDPGKWPDSPCMVATAPDDHGRPERVRGRLGVCVSRDQTHSEVRYNPSYGRQTAVSSKNRPFPSESRSCQFDDPSSNDSQGIVVIDERDSELVHPIGGDLCLGNARHSVQLNAVASSHQRANLKNEEGCRSGDKNVSERRAVHSALPPTIQVMDSLVSQALTRPHTRYETSNDHIMAVFSFNPRSTRRPQDRRLDVSIRHYGNTVSFQCLNPNVTCKTKSKTLLALSTDRGKWPYSPCTVTTTPNNDGRPEKGHERLGVRYLPRKKGE
jgi:hypothetical protein